MRSFRAQPRLNDEEISPKELTAYRDRTRAIVKRYFRISLETGRLPSLLGGKCFRARVTSYRLTSFEDAVIFVHDVEKCVNMLDGFSKNLVAYGLLQGYRHEEISRILNCPLRSVQRNFPRAVDNLSLLFLRHGIIQPMMVNPTKVPFPAQHKENKGNIIGIIPFTNP